MLMCSKPYLLMNILPMLHRGLSPSLATVVLGRGGSSNKSDSRKLGELFAATPIVCGHALFCIVSNGTELLCNKNYIIM